MNLSVFVCIHMYSHKIFTKLEKIIRTVLHLYVALLLKNMSIPQYHVKLSKS